MATLTLSSKNSGTMTDSSKSNKWDYLIQENGSQIVLDGYLGSIILEQTVAYPPLIALATKSSGSFSLATKH